MKREYITGLFLLVFITTIIVLSSIFNDQIIGEYLHKFVVIWLLLAIYIGQYSMKFPKRF